ncbi:GntR family transcriptional regulator [Lysinibacter sp. HNR]|uniref:GntR family transcriptional regulator n=1 Tax=Lysinibacter sp. HNR TaxID=3031408 RepID=UPI00243558D7|nr:GntR family transcriptional regulator [Lysinibacter sp. HNR]WGD38340.1 GntR family transcriptional regulator [Lysinibacter sp. HNR]
MEQSNRGVSLGSLFDDLDRNGPIPLYYQVASRLEQAIHDGTIPAGSRLENEISLGERLGLSRPTIRRAIQELVEKGLLVRRRGVGTQVVHGGITRGVEFTSLYEDLREGYQKPTTRVLLHRETPATAEVAHRLVIPEGAPVLHLRRLRMTDGEPIAILENHLPEQFLDISEEELTETGLYLILRARGTSLRVAKQRIGARRAMEGESALLKIDSGGPVLTTERTAYNSDGLAIEHGQHCYRTDYYSFETTLVSR